MSVTELRKCLLLSYGNVCNRVTEMSVTGMSMCICYRYWLFKVPRKTKSWFTDQIRLENNLKSYQTHTL